MKIENKHSNNFTITDTTTATKHCSDPDDNICNISGITYFSSAISDTSLFSVISKSEETKHQHLEKFHCTYFQCKYAIQTIYIY